MTNITLMKVDNGYVCSYPAKGCGMKTYIFKSLQESFDFVARLFNDVDYYNEQLVEAVKSFPHQNEDTNTSNSVTA